MDWLKDRPGLQWILSTLSTILIVFLTFWLTGWASDKEKVDESIRTLELEKAPYEYVDKKYSDHIDYDLNQDAKIETMRIEWREDQKEILELIRAIK